MGILAAGGFRWSVRQSAKRPVQAEGAVGGSLEERPGGSGNAVPVQAGDHFATTGLGEIDHGTACCYEELNSVSSEFVTSVGGHRTLCRAQLPVSHWVRASLRLGFGSDSLGFR